MEPECTLAVFCIPFIIRPLRSADAKSGIGCLKDSAQLAQMGSRPLFPGEHLRAHQKNRAGYDQGPEIHGKPRKVSLLVGKAQLAGCLKVWESDLLE